MRRDKSVFSYCYDIYFSRTKDAGVVVLRVVQHRKTTKVVDKENRKKMQYRKVVARYNEKPPPLWMTPKLTDPFTVKDGEITLFKLSDPYWIAVVTKIILSR